MPKTKLVIGIDEAGYGPSMGPLVIGATTWRVPVALDVFEWSDAMGPEFLPKPFRSGSTHVPIGDSKKIHHDKTGHASLTCGASFLYGQCFPSKSRSFPLEHVLSKISQLDAARLQSVPWYGSTVVSNFCFEDAPQVDEVFRCASNKLHSLNVELVDLRARIIDEPEFNKLVDQVGNKSTLLTELSLGLVREAVIAVAQPLESIDVYCDKHGGRNRYQPFLLNAFDQEWFSILAEGQRCSQYSAVWNSNPLSIQFQVEGDSIFPSAASSIVAKWLREKLMARLNLFWQMRSHVPLASTAGYFVDATRFAKEIEKKAGELGLVRDSWWRKK